MCCQVIAKEVVDFCRASEKNVSGGSVVGTPPFLHKSSVLLCSVGKDNHNILMDA